MPSSATPSHPEIGSKSNFATPNTPASWEKQKSNPPSRANLSSRHDMVHRLRQQVKSRDELILEVHAQLREQERTIRMHEIHEREFEGQLQAAHRLLFEADAEIQRLRKVLSTTSVGFELEAAGLSGEFSCPGRNSNVESQVSTVKKFEGSLHPTQQACQQQLCQQQQDLQTLAAEVKRLADELRNAERERRDREMTVSLNQKENAFLIEKLKCLEAELEENRKANMEKDLMLQRYEREGAKTADALQGSKKISIDEAGSDHELPTVPKSHTAHVSQGRRHSSADAQTGAYGFENSPIAESFSHPGDVVRSYNTLFATTPEPSRGSSGSTSKSCLVETGADIAGDGQVIESLLVALQEEVDQLSTALEEGSKVVQDKRLQSSRLVSKLQEEEYVLNNFQFQRTLEELGVVAADDEQDLEEFSRFLSFSKGITSAAQVQELSHKLEQLARQQKVEEEILELEKHQTRIAELKQQVEKLSTRFSSYEGKDLEGCEATEKQASRLAALAVELAKKLTLQEEQTRQTCLEAQQLSPSAQLSSPYIPTSKKNELRKKLHSNHTESKVSLAGSQHKHSDNHSTQARYIMESGAQFNGIGLSDNHISSAEPSPFQSPVSVRRFLSIHNVEDSPAVRIGSPTIMGDLRSSAAVEVTLKCGSFNGNTSRNYELSVVGGEDKTKIREGPSDQSSVMKVASDEASTSMSPFSKMMARLESNQMATAPRLTSRDLEDYGSQILDSSKCPRSGAPEEGNSAEKSQRQTGFGSDSGSLDSSFDEMLDNTLEDLVRVCSEATTPVTSPALSTASDCERLIGDQCDS